jgi:hypothetical protein
MRIHPSHVRAAVGGVLNLFRGLFGNIEISLEGYSANIGWGHGVRTGNGRNRRVTPAMSTCSPYGWERCYVRDVGSCTMDNGRIDHRLVTLTPLSNCWSTSAERSFSPPFIGVQLLKVIDQTVERRGREARRGVVCPGNRGFPGPREAEGATSLADVCAAQDREARHGPRQGELPASLPASLSGSLSLSVTVSPAGMVRRGAPDLAPSRFDSAARLVLRAP